MVTLDNASIHLTDNTKRAAEILKMKLFFLHPYSPSLTPVEWVFGMRKKIVSTAKSEGTINYGNKEWRIEDSWFIEEDRFWYSRRQLLNFINSIKIKIGEILHAAKT